MQKQSEPYEPIEVSDAIDGILLAAAHFKKQAVAAKDAGVPVGDWISDALAMSDLNNLATALRSRKACIVDGRRGLEICLEYARETGCPDNSPKDGPGCGECIPCLAGRILREISSSHWSVSAEANSPDASYHAETKAFMEEVKGVRPISGHVDSVRTSTL